MDNVWDPASRTSKARVLHSFGREDELDRAAIERLIDSLRRLLDPAAALSGLGPQAGGDPAAGLAFVSSRALGATWALDGVWHQLGLDVLLRRLLAETRRAERVERVIFGLVAARAIEPASKLATAAWLSRRTFIAGLTDDPPVTDEEADIDDGEGRPAVGEDECYRAMDWLIEAAAEVEREVFWSLATLLDLEVDLLFFDTASTYFCTEDGDVPVARDDRGHRLLDGAGEHAAPAEAVPPPAADEQDGGPPGRAGFRTWGKSKDHREDLPQIVIGMAVTRTGIPVRVWSELITEPGNTTDTALIRQAKSDLREWTLARIVWVGDRGFTSAANRRDLRAGGHGYILGEKLRSGSSDAHAALARQGRYKTVADNLQVKEVKVREDERFVVCFNPEAAERDAALRQVMIRKLEELIAGSDALSERKRAELAKTSKTCTSASSPDPPAPSPRPASPPTPPRRCSPRSTSRRRRRSSASTPPPDSPRAQPRHRLPGNRSPRALNRRVIAPTSTFPSPGEHPAAELRSMPGQSGPGGCSQQADSFRRSQPTPFERGQFMTGLG